MKTQLTITLAAASILSFSGRSQADDQSSSDLPTINGSTVAQTSTVGGKIEIPLSTFSRLLNQSGSKTFRKTTGVERYNVRLQKFSVSSTGRGLVLKTPISGSGTMYKEKRKGLKAHVNFDIKYGSVTVYAVPEITSDFKINTNITSVNMNAQIVWRTKLFKGNRSIQQKFARAEVAKMARDMDRQLSAKLNLRGEVAKIWAQTHGVLEMPGSSPTYLVTEPVAVRCGKPSFSDRSKIQFALSVECKSALHLEQPEISEAKSMPHLSIRRGQSSTTAFRAPMMVPLATLEGMSMEGMTPRFSSTDQQLRFADESDVSVDLSSEMASLAEEAGQLPYLRSGIDAKKVKVEGVKMVRTSNGEAALIDLVIHQSGSNRLTF